MQRLLGIVVLVEFLNINLATTFEMDEALNLFGVEPVKPKKNLRTLYGELVNFYMKNAIYNHLEDKKKKEKFKNLNDDASQSKLKEEYEEVEAFCKTFVLLHKYFERLNGYEKFHDYKNPEFRDYQMDMQDFVDEFSLPIWVIVREIMEIQENTEEKRREKANRINREHGNNFKKEIKKRRVEADGMDNCFYLFYLHVCFGIICTIEKVIDGNIMKIGQFN